MEYGYPLDLRKRIVAEAEATGSARAAARRYGASPSCGITLVAQWRKTESLEPGQFGGQKKRKLADDEGWLHDVMTAEPDITLAELRSRLAEMGIEIFRQSIDDTLHALGYRYKEGPRTRRNKNAPTWRGSAFIGAIGSIAPPLTAVAGAVRLCR